jgi:hypothetical protein
VVVILLSAFIFGSLSEISSSNIWNAVVINSYARSSKSRTFVKLFIA